MVNADFFHHLSEKWQPSVDLAGTVARLTQRFIGVTASEIALLLRSIQEF